MNNNLLENEEKYNCIHYGIAQIAQALGCDYEMIFLELWLFKYFPNKKKKIGENLDINWIDNSKRRKYLLKKYHGLDYHIMKPNLVIASEEVKFQPILALFDAYDCDWLPFYQKQHIKHWIVIYSIISEKIYFYDQYSSFAQKKCIDIHFWVRYCQKIAKFSSGVSEVGKKDYLEEIVMTGKTFSELQSIDNLHYFISDMWMRFELSLEIDKNDIVSSKLIMGLKYISDDRYNLIFTFNYLEKILGTSFLDIKDKLNQASKKYSELRYNIIKWSFIKGYVNPKSLSDILFSVEDIEKKINDYFLNIELYLK